MDIGRAIMIQKDRLNKTPPDFRERSLKLMFDIADLEQKQREVLAHFEQIPEARNVP